MVEVPSATILFSTSSPYHKLKQKQPADSAVAIGKAVALLGAISC